MADIKALVTAGGFLALLLALGGMLIFYGLAAEGVASAAKSMGMEGGSGGDFPIFLGVMFALFAVGIYIVARFKACKCCQGRSESPAERLHRPGPALGGFAGSIFLR